MQKETIKNKAFVLIKPSAFNQKIYDELVPNVFETWKINIIRKGIFDSEEMESKIDAHYSKISGYARNFDEKEITEEAKKKFYDKFNVDLENVRIVMPPDDYDVSDWRLLEKHDRTVKLCDGLYCGQCGPEEFMVNGFYPSMRRQYTEKDCQSYWYEIEFDFDFNIFKVGVIGSTDPSKASEGSIRRILYDDWEKLGLKRQSSTGENGIHGSENMNEALLEIITWLS